MVKDMSLSLLYDYYGSFLTDKQADVFELFYNEDLSLSEIGEHLGITRQGVRDALKRGEEILKEMEEKIGMVRKTTAIIRATELLKDLSNDYAKYNCNDERLYTLNKIIGEIIDGI